MAAIVSVLGKRISLAQARRLRCADQGHSEVKEEGGIVAPVAGVSRPGNGPPVDAYCVDLSRISVKRASAFHPAVRVEVGLAAAEAESP
jgi:hypothetical protein